jgi:hypothetical protein
MTALLAPKGQQLGMRPEAGLPAVQFHDSPAQFAAGWCKACFRGSLHLLSLDLGFPHRPLWGRLVSKVSSPAVRTSGMS